MDSINFKNGWFISSLFLIFISLVTCANTRTNKNDMSIYRAVGCLSCHQGDLLQSKQSSKKSNSHHSIDKS